MSNETPPTTQNSSQPESNDTTLNVTSPYIVFPKKWVRVTLVSSEPVTQEMIVNFKPVVTNARLPSLPRSRRRTEKDPEG